ncbi:MAG: polyisoprenoid-binding protein [Chryseobacterium sp.]|nr:MAG: polyisoprenoid-binding protein [Chryseobacterium sp.]
MNKLYWVLDPAHSELGFKIRHLMISNVSGAFQNFQVEAQTEDDSFSKASISVTVDVASISTGEEQRDNHLRNADFFDVGNYPTLKFLSTKIEKVDEENFILFGELTMKGITKPIKLNVEFGGVISDERHGMKAGFTVTGKIIRSEWGLSFNRILETGGVGLGEEVKIFSELQLVKSAEANNQ